MFKKENENKSTRNSPSFQLILILIFSAVLLVLCAFIFIYNYENVYDKNTNGGYFSPKDGVIFNHIVLALVALLTSGILKIILKHRVQILPLIILSIVLPILYYNINYHSFKKDAVLYPLVNEGGAFHFITIHDFNFDGVNDEYDYTGNDVRELSHIKYYAAQNDYVSAMNYTIVGKGGNLDASYCQYFDGKIRISLQKSRVTYNSIKITLSFKNSVAAEKVSLYLFNSKLETTLENHNTVSVVFDADICAEWQQTSLEEKILIPIRCILNE